MRSKVLVASLLLMVAVVVAPPGSDGAVVVAAPDGVPQLVVGGAGVLEFQEPVVDFSADGRYVAYVSTECSSGTSCRNVVYWGDRGAPDAEGGFDPANLVTAEVDRANREDWYTQLYLNVEVSDDGSKVTYTDEYYHDRVEYVWQWTAGNPSGSAGAVSAADGSTQPLWSDAPVYGDRGMSTSSDGTLVAFVSGRSGLDMSETSGNPDADVYVRDTSTNTLRRLTDVGEFAGLFSYAYLEEGVRNVSLSDDGRWLAVDSVLPLDDSNNDFVDRDVFLFDLSLTDPPAVRLSAGLSGFPANGESYNPSVSGDGRFVAFTTEATNVVAGTATSDPSAIVYRIADGSMSLVSDEGPMHGPVWWSSDGSTLAYWSGDHSTCSSACVGEVLVKEVDDDMNTIDETSVVTPGWNFTLTGDGSVVSWWDSGVWAQRLLAPGATPPYIEVAPEDTTGLSGSVGVAVEDPVNTASGNLVDSYLDLGGEAFGLDVTRAYNTFDTDMTPAGERWRIGVGGVLEDQGGAVRFELADGTPFVFVADGVGGWLTPAGLRASLVADPATPVGGGPLPMLRVEYFNGNVDRFDTTGRLIEQISWDGRSASSTYATSGLLDTVTASTGQVLAFSYDGTDRLVSVLLSNGRGVTYGYDANDRLVSVSDEFGAATSLSYTDEGWLELMVGPSGETIMSNTFDADGRVLTQTSSSGGITTFSYNLAAGTTDVHDSVTDTAVTYHHDPQGRVVMITDAYGNDVTRAFDGDSNFTNSLDRTGASSSATYDSHKNVTSVTKPGVGTTHYVYDAHNRVATMTDPSGATTTYGYELDERIPSTVTDHLGNSSTYDVVDGLVMSVTDPDGVMTTYGYDTQRRLTTVANAYGETTSIEYNARGQRSRQTSPSGRETSWSYDPVTHRLISMTAPDGGVTTYTHDAAGRVLTVTDPTNATTTNTYDTAGRLATITDPAGEVTTFEYDQNDQLIKTTEPGGGEATATYGPLGRLISETDQLQRTTTYSYDAEGRRTSSTAPDGGVLEAVYDADGRMSSTIDGTDRETLTTYDSFGRVDTVTEPGGLITTYTYDPVGRVATVTDPRGGVTTTEYTPGGRHDSVTDPAGLATTYDYDLAGRLNSITAPGDLVTTVTYNTDSEIATQTSPGGLTTTWAYDPAGRIASIIDPAGVVTTNSWSQRGELLTTTTGDQGTVIYDYNPTGTLAAATDPLGHTTTFTYDARGNLTNRVAPNTAEYTWTYDAANQLLASTEPGPAPTGYEVLANDNFDLPDGSQPDPAQWRNPTLTNGATVSIEQGNLRATLANTSGSRATLRSLTETSSLDHDVTLTYRFSSTTSAERARLTAFAAYSGTDRVWVQINSNETSGTIFQRVNGTNSQVGTFPTAKTTDARRLRVRFDSGTLQVRTWAPTDPEPTTWDAELEIADITGAGDARLELRRLKGSPTIWVDDWEQRSTQSTPVGEPAARTTTYTYDTAGRLATTTDPTGRAITRTYNLDGTIDSLTHDGGDTLQYGYDSAGRVDTITNADGTYTIGYEPGGTISSTVTDDARITSWAYDTAGRRTSMTYPDGTVYDYTYDTAGRLATITPDATATPLVTYGYNDDSQVTSETLLDGTRTRSYTDGQLTGFTATQPGLNLTTTRTYDNTGRIGTETTNGTTTTYTYDQASQLTAATPTTAAAMSWTYDNNGQRTTETTAEATTTFLHDIAGQLCWTTTNPAPTDPECTEPPSAATTYSYDDDGRLETESNPTGDTTTYTYGPDGNLTTVERDNGTATTTQTRTYNQLGQLNQILDNTGTPTASSLDWDPTGTIPSLTGITTDGTATGIVQGQTGPTIEQRGGQHHSIGLDAYNNTNPTATTTLARSDTYTPYGNPSGPATTTPQLGYRGELTIHNVTHLRARDYQPSIGAFTTTDPAPGVPGTTTLNNRYTYVNNNPLHLIDPLGLYGIDDNALSGRFQAPGVPVTGTTVPTAAAPVPPTTAAPNIGVAPGKDYSVLCGPPSGPSTSQTPGACEWAEDMPGLGEALLAAVTSQGFVEFAKNVGVATVAITGGVALCSTGAGCIIVAAAVIGGGANFVAEESLDCLYRECLDFSVGELNGDLLQGYVIGASTGVLNTQLASLLGSSAPQVGLLRAGWEYGLDATGAAVATQAGERAVVTFLKYLVEETVGRR